MALDPGHPQYGEMVRKMGAEGGFTYNPRKDIYETEGWAVSPYPEHERTSDPGKTTPASMHAYHADKGEALASAPHMMGGWRNKDEPGGTKDYLDVSKVYPPTGGGQSAARYQSVKHNQRASMNLGTFEEDVNPFHASAKAGPDVPITSINEKFPEFAHLATSGASMSQVAKQAPEMAAWMQSPSRREKFQAGNGG